MYVKYKMEGRNDREKEGEGDRENGRRN